MKHFKKNRLMVAVIALMVMFFAALTIHNEVEAYTWSWDDPDWSWCVKSAGEGRSDIYSVQWACWKTRPADGSYGCAIWLGSPTDTSTLIYLDEGDTTVYGYYYRMCTSVNGVSHNDAASNVYAYNDGDSIGYGGYVGGGYWASPGSTRVSINVASFINGASVRYEDDYTYYSRTITINRCNATNTSSCDTQDANITLAVRKPQKKKLTMIAIDTNGQSLSSYAPNQEVEVNSGSSASLTAYDLSSYHYIKVKWGTSTWNSSWWDDANRTYTVGSLTSDTTIYAVYQLDQKTLTMKAVDSNGNSLSHLMADKSVTVVAGSSASLTADNLVGYTKKWWGTSATGGRTANTGMTYTVNPLNSNTTIYAVYERHEFAARARVFEGNNTSGTNSKSTGYVETNNTQTLNINCLNSGCTATFDLAAKNVVGSAAMNYVVYRSQNGGSGSTQYVNPASPYAMSSSGTTIKIYSGGNYLNSITETILPGQTVCYYITFYPFGSYSNTTTATAKACAHANPSTFEGQSKVTTGSGTTTSGWRNTSTNGTQNISGCTTAGCSITFQHYLRRTSGIGSTTYNVTRTSNYSTISGATLKSGTEAFTGVSNNTSVLEYQETITLMPGQVVCETLTFKPSNDVVNVASNVVIKICASALGNAQPPDPTPPTTLDDDDLSDAFLDMRVKNPTGATEYRKYQETVYAKPGQVLSYRSSYNPVLQYAYYVYPQKFRLNGTGTVYPTSGINTASTLGTMFNAYKGSYGNWNNSYTVFSKTGGFLSGYSEDFIYSNGQTEKRVNTNTHQVKTGEVGRNLAETAATNKNNRTKTTVSQVTFTADGSSNNVANTYTANKTSTANAYVPYNYDTTLKIEEDDDEVIYAGEEKNIKYEIDVIPKTNNKTTDGSDGEKYATIMRDAISKVVIYLGTEKPQSNGWNGTRTADVCNYFIGAASNGTTCKFANEKTEDLNPSGILTGSQHKLELLMQVPDVVAGTQLCVAVASFPASSGLATNWDSTDGNNKWRISKSRCFTIAKKPLFEVWGGSVYSGGSIRTAVTTKNNLAGVGDLGGVIVFGSWSEQSVVSLGQTFGMASGAATGLATNAAGGGSYEGSTPVYCTHRVPLSLANYSSSALSGICGNTQATGNSGISAVISNKESLVGTLPNEDSKVYEYTANSTIALNNTGGKDVIRYNSSASLTINASVANTGKTHIVHAKGDVMINGNITYQGGSSTTYSDMGSIPKVIIYGNNITIGCSVTTINAILIAEQDITTCASSDINLRANSTQLTINGAIISNKLFLNRTHGAATGANSKVPGEIVNYDISTLLWGRAKSDPGNEHKNLTAVYSHEIAPRY